MPLVSSYNSDDGRVSCRMMAESALKSLQDHDHRMQNFDQLQNAYRMLKSYRLGIFNVPRSYGVGQAVIQDDGDDDDVIEEKSINNLIVAFDNAKNTAFEQKDTITPEQAASILQQALQTFVNKEKLSDEDKAAIERSCKFFEALLEELS